MLVTIGAVSDECIANADGDLACSGSDRTALLQARMQVISEEDTAAEKFQAYSHTSLWASRSLLAYFQTWAQSAIDSRLAQIVPAPAFTAFQSGSETISATAMYELFASALLHDCPLQASSLRANATLEVLQAESATTDRVHHVLLKVNQVRMQYLAFHRAPNGQYSLLVADPPVCSHSHRLVALQAEGVEQNITVTAEPLEGGPDMLTNDDPLVTDCKNLFVRTVKSNCNKTVNISVSSANRSIIDGIMVHMIAQVCSTTTNQCHPHRPVCVFETSIHHVDAKLLQLRNDTNAIANSTNDTLPEEQMGLNATLKLSIPLCDADLRDGVSQIQAREDSLLQRYGMGEKSFYKGFEHVYDNYAEYRILDVDIPSEIDFRKQYPKCFPALSGKGVGTETVRNQGTCGSCWAFAAATSTMINMCISGDLSHSLQNASDRFEVSVQQTMSCLPEGASTTDGCQGGTIQGFDRVAKTWGLAKERDNLYKCSAGDPKNHFEEKNQCNIFPWGGSCTKTSNPLWWWGGIAKAKGETAMMSFLASGQSLYVGMIIYTNFFELRTEVYTKVQGSKLGGHAMTCMGYGVSQGVKYWLLQNSWGLTGWGEEGFGKVQRGINLGSIEDYGFAPRAWVTGGKEPPCQDSTTGSGLLSSGKALSCSESKDYCVKYPSVASMCPQTCSTCNGTNGQKSSPSPGPGPSPPPSPGPGPSPPPTPQPSPNPTPALPECSDKSHSGLESPENPHWTCSQSKSYCENYDTVRANCPQTCGVCSSTRS
jgi:hypothetical protein